MSEIKTWDVHTGKRWPEAREIIEAMQAEIDDLRAALDSVAAAGAASEWNDFVEIACARIKSADDAAADGDYMLDSSDCIKVLRGTWGGNYLNDHPVLPAAGAAPEPTKTVDRAWSRFCGCIGRGPDAPYPGMIEAFESHYGQNFTDKDWRNETGIWAAAWGYATRQAGAAPVPEDWRSAVAMAYGHLWHINNEPMAPIPLRSEESASYAARKLLRDLLTTEERGEAINSVRAMLTASPKEPT